MQAIVCAIFAVRREPVTIIVGGERMDVLDNPYLPDSGLYLRLAEKAPGYAIGYEYTFQAGEYRLARKSVFAGLATVETDARTGKVTGSYPPVINSEKTTIHAKSDEGSKKLGYLVAGDRVEPLDIQSGRGMTFVKIVYKKSRTTGWVNYYDLEFEDTP